MVFPSRLATPAAAILVAAGIAAGGCANPPSGTASGQRSPSPARDRGTSAVSVVGTFGGQYAGVNERPGVRRPLGPDALSWRGLSVPLGTTCDVDDGIAPRPDRAEEFQRAVDGQNTPRSDDLTDFQSQP